MIVPSAMVKAADHMKNHVMNPIDVSALLCMIDWGAGQCYMILLGEECLHMIG